MTELNEFVYAWYSGAEQTEQIRMQNDCQKRNEKLTVDLMPL